MWHYELLVRCCKHVVFSENSRCDFAQNIAAKEDFASNSILTSDLSTLKIQVKKYKDIIMNKTKAKPSTGEGWAVHVYSDRYLRFTLEPSHIQAFGWGIEVGILVATTWSALYSASSPSTNSNH